MNNLVFVDTSALYAMLDKSDFHYDESISIISYLKKQRYRVFTTNYVIVETYSLILGRLGDYLSRKWIKNVAIPLEHSTSNDLKRAVEIVLRWQDKTFSLIDAISFVIMERYNCKSAFAFDRHFVQYGFQLVTAE